MTAGRGTLPRMPEPSTTDELLAALAKLKPVPDHLKVWLDGDDEARTVKITNTRKRWHRVGGVLASLDWHTVEARDKAGAVLATFRDAGEPSPTDEVQIDATAGGVTIRELQLLQMLQGAFNSGARVATEAAEKAVARHAATFRALGEGVRAQLDALTQGSRIATAQYQQALLVQREVLTAGGGVEASDAGGLAALAPLLAAVAQHANGAGGKSAGNGKAAHKDTKKTPH